MVQTARHENQDDRGKPDFDSLIESISGLPDLLLAMTSVYAPEAQRLIHTKTRDIQQIEHILDRLLDCACLPEGLALFKALCRHLYTINPSIAAFHVNAYRERWDNESS